MKKLTKSQRDEIIAMYEHVLSREDVYGVAGGAHWELMACLDRCGIRCNSTDGAKRIARKIYNGQL